MRCPIPPAGRTYLAVASVLPPAQQLALVSFCANLYRGTCAVKTQAASTTETATPAALDDPTR